jgi:hypothetical protein
MFFFDPLWLILAIPGLILGLWAQMRVRSAFGTYSKVGNARGFTGAQAARAMLDYYGLQEVRIEEVNGFLSDHYDPRSRTLRLSPDVGRSQSISAVGVAAHEAGHALQHAKGYAPLSLRSALVPATQFGSFLGPLLFMGGFLLQTISSFGYNLAVLGLILFALTTVFSVVTLPVEFDASKRAKQELVKMNILSQQEMVGVNKTLNAAALTYVAAAIAAIGQVLYYALLLFGRRD